MLACYQCYEKVGKEIAKGFEEKFRQVFERAWEIVWDHLSVDTSTRRKCEICGREGFFVREVRYKA
jgi:hypothetical protein